MTELQHYAEIGRWQEAIREHVIKRSGAPAGRIDGACSDGNELDLTLAEIGQGITYVADQRDELTQRLAEVEAERDQLKAYFAETVDPVAEAQRFAISMNAEQRQRFSIWLVEWSRAVTPETPST